MKFWQVDAFTHTPFKGNPAAVFVLDAPLDDTLMLNIAKEMNLSETAFILRRAGENPLLRWFTPVEEIDLCGHATLASAHIYMSEIDPDCTSITFDTVYAGALTVIKNQDTYTMDFPARAGEAVALDDIPDFILDALSDTRPIAAYKSRDLMLVYDDEATIRDMQPDYGQLKKHKDFIIVTSPKIMVTGQGDTDTDYDFVSRFFCADDGIDEDPVTGSAHCTLAPYWAQRLGKNTLQAYQASARGGALGLDVTTDRIHITGPAITVIHGQMCVKTTY